MERNDRELYKLETLDNYELENSDQDLRGQVLCTSDGNEIGRVADMLVNTDSECVAAVRLEDNRVVDIEHVDIRDGRPVLLVPHDRIPRASADFDRNNMTSKHIPIVEERLVVGKRAVESGKVRIRTRIEEQPVSETVELRDERVEIDRRPVNERVGGAEASAMFQDQDIKLTERSEKAVVGKEARVKEELVINKESGTHKETVKDTVRHTEVDIDRNPGERR